MSFEVQRVLASNPPVRGGGCESWRDSPFSGTWVAALGRIPPRVPTLVSGRAWRSPDWRMSFLSSARSVSRGQVVVGTMAIHDALQEGVLGGISRNLCASFQVAQRLENRLQVLLLC